MSDTQKYPISLVDLDGTLADYDKAMYAALEYIRSPEEPPVLLDREDENRPEYLDRRRRLVQNQPGFWRNLELIPQNMLVYEIMEELGFEIHICTHGPDPKKCPAAWSEKAEWCAKYLWDRPGTAMGLAVVRDKSLMYGKVLFDDYPKYVAEWLIWRPRGLVIMPAYEYNKKCNDPRIVRYDGTNLDEVRERLIIARDR